MSIRAQFPGECVDCEVPIRIGNAIVRVHGAGGYRHLVCPDDPDTAADTAALAQPRCTTCGTHHVGEC